MCDTFVVMPSFTKDGSVIFGKNSDRDCNEPQVILRQPRKTYDLSTKPMIDATYIQVPQIEETYEVVLSKPDWMWGCEMAFNEFGVVIGNEAVFTKEEAGPPALTGMDMVRIAAERSKNADEALDCIIALLDIYGQGGNCGYQSPLEYHNGFLIADPKKAWILETAGEFWAAKEVKDYGVISNGLSIESDYDRCHPQLVENAIKKGYCRQGEKFNFTKAYAKSDFKIFTKYEDRRCLAGEFIRGGKGIFDVSFARNLLRLHSKKQDGKEFYSGSMASICMHGGGMISSQTTSSLIARLDGKRNDYYLTASSLPCITLFKPFWFESSAPLWSEDDQKPAVEYWRKREAIHRMILAGRIDVNAHREEMRVAEGNIDALVAAVTIYGANEKIDEVIKESYAIDETFIEGAIRQATPDNHKDVVKGNPFFKAYWKKSNENIDAGPLC